jgi:tetratricopeptide (TPR) repeat protein
MATLHAEQKDTSTKKERNLISKGNDLYKSNDFSDAETTYKKALEQNVSSDIAKFNLASSLLKQSGNTPADSPSNPAIKADSLFRELTTSDNNQVAEHSFYNLGNMMFDKQDYAKSIEMYKSALRINPSNNNARENLRLAQLRLQQQQQNKDKNKDKNKDQQQDKQDQQDQNKDKQDQQNKQDQKQNNDKKDENKDKQDQQSQQQDKKKKEKQQQQSQGISDANAEKILKTMENEENATRKKVNEKKKQEEMRNASRRQITNQW